MKANPGGHVTHTEVIGRDEIIEEIWQILEKQSIIMTAERRIGKTSIMQKMQAEVLGSWVPVFQDLEQYYSAEEFAMSVYKTIQNHLSSKKRAANRANDLLKKLGGTEIAGVFTLPTQRAVPWQMLLTNAVEDLVTEQPEEVRLLFLWDEMPFMLANIRDNSGEESAMQVLNILRSLRQTHQGFRMLMTGSIGLHHVIKSFKDSGHSRASVNDMFFVDVPPLDLTYATKLASWLIEGEALKCKDVNTTAKTVAECVDGFPFYIHHVVRALKKVKGNIDSNSVKGVVECHLTDANDPWELRHYKDRIATYYGSDKARVLLVLDELSLQKNPLSARDLLTRLNKVGQTDIELEYLRNLLTLMSQDHYLIREGKGYRYRFPLIQRWWKIEREL